MNGGLKSGVLLEFRLSGVLIKKYFFTPYPYSLHIKYLRECSIWKKFWWFFSPKTVTLNSIIISFSFFFFIFWFSLDWIEFPSPLIQCISPFLSCSDHDERWLGLDLVLLRLLPWNHLGVCEHLLNFAWRRRRCEARLSLLCVCIMMMASTVYIASGKSRTWNMFTNAAASSFNVYVNFVFVPTSLSMYSY